MLIPGQPTWLIGVEVLATALFFTAFTIVGQITARGQRPPVAMIRFGGGLYLLGAVLFFMFAWNIYIAWIVITGVSEAG